MKYKILITPLLFVALLQKVNAQTKYEISSPDQSLKVNVILKDKQLFYQVNRNGA